MRQFDRSPRGAPAPRPARVRAGLLAVAALSAAPAAATDDDAWIYWSDYGQGSISRVRPDGSGAAPVLTGINAPLGIAVDAAAGKLYWTDTSMQRIRRSNLDGTGVETVVMTGPGTPYGLALDPAAGQVYWSEYPGGDGIQRANLDGTGVQNVVATAGAGGVAVDHAAGRLYWTDYSSGRVGRAALDGSSVEVLASGRPNPNHVLLDRATGRLLWSEGVGIGRVMALDLAGGGLVTLVGGENSPTGLALDEVTRTLYWANESGSAIRQASADDGSGVATLVGGAARPLGVALAGMVAGDTTPPDIAVPATVIAEATAADGAVVTFEVTATDDQDPAPAVACDPPSGSPFALGDTTVVCAASDAAGNEAEESFVVSVRDTAAPEMPALSDLAVTATAAAGATVSYSVPAAADVVDGAVPLVCSPSSGSTFAPGSTTVTCTATDAADNSAAGQFVVHVAMSWSNVLQPINLDGSSIFKLGSTVPVKFRLAGSSAGIADLVARLYVAKLGSGIAGTEIEASSTSAADSGNTFRYDGSAVQYVFNWGTKGLTAGTYQLRIDLGDGVLRTVRVSLKQ